MIQTLMIESIKEVLSTIEITYVKEYLLDLILKKFLTAETPALKMSSKT